MGKQSKNKKQEAGEHAYLSGLFQGKHPDDFQSFLICASDPEPDMDLYPYILNADGAATMWFSSPKTAKGMIPRLVQGRPDQKWMILTAGTAHGLYGHLLNLANDQSEPKITQVLVDGECLVSLSDMLLVLNNFIELHRKLTNN